ncbi:MFS transporter [Sphingosinicella terrae]|uniref:MFS transporter n=1 Tax=Sphingosinicella terrae TaxID=2172047 RepID=UPI000E0D001D|nr:MFS transporter [Sphingosinicella terrae]
MTDARISRNTAGAFASVTTLFFAWGFITSLIDPLVAAVKGIFSLTDFQAQLSASAFFIAYGVMSFPAAVLLARRQAVTTILVALAMMVAGCLTMLLAANVAIYGLVLLGLFVLASGITVLQVAANPLAAVLGPPERSHFRLTFSQAFNSFGTFIGPYLGAVLFLKGVEVKEGTVLTDEVRNAALGGIDAAFFWIAGLIILLAFFIWSARGLITAAAPAPPMRIARRGMIATIAEAASSRWALLGGAAIFLYVGAEVAIGTQMALFLNSDDVLGVTLEDAGKMVSLYWGGAMVGRLIGSVLLTRVPAATLLAVFTAAACGLCLYVFSVGGISAGYAALSIGLFNSIMFPVIFTLTLERSSASEEATSGFLCFSIVGGAAIPPLVGLVSGQTSYGFAFIVPAVCYALLLAFAVAAGQARVNRPAADEPLAAVH